MLRVFLKDAGAGGRNWGVVNHLHTLTPESIFYDTRFLKEKHDQRKRITPSKIRLLSYRRVDTSSQHQIVELGEVIKHIREKVSFYFRSLAHSYSIFLIFFLRALCHCHGCNNHRNSGAKFFHQHRV